nr:MAG TPA: hypothetical protein [Caudoviricetes sp.]
MPHILCFKGVYGMMPISGTAHSGAPLATQSPKRIPPKMFPPMA